VKRGGAKRRRPEIAEPERVGKAPPDTGGGDGRRFWVLFAVVATASSVAVAGAFVSAPHNGGDNAGYISLAYSLLQDGTYRDIYDPAGLPHTKYPPLFPALLALSIFAGVRTWVGLKLVAAVSTIGAIVFAHLWAVRRIGPYWAACASLALAFSPAIVDYSHWVLSDPTFLLFTLAALWALERAGEEGAKPGWMIGGVAATGLAYFTRSAGLPLVVALVAWLALRRRWRTLAVTLVALGVPAVLWWLRARGVGDVQYVSEFWMVDPYDPAKGTITVVGLAGRVAANLGGYVTGHVPGGLAGGLGAFGAALGVILTAAAVLGWGLQVRRGPGPGEFFFPLYAGLILLWPVVWSGGRFALPLFPLLIVFAASAVRRLAGSGVLGRALAAAGLSLILLPALGSWTESVQRASACAAAVRQSGPFACYGPRMTQFAEAGAWAAENLPPGAAVMTRKPRLFFVLSGVPSRTFPFDPDPGVQLAAADGLGARFLLLDQVDGLAGRYVGSAVQRQPGAFCHVQTFGAAQGPASQLLGMLPVGERGEPVEDSGDGSVRIGVCPQGYARHPDERVAYSSSPTSGRIPLLERVDP